MKTKKIIVYGLLAVILALAFTALSLTGCSGSGGGKSLNSAAELKEYLDKQPANSPDKPIKVAMKANDMMIGNIAEVLKKTDKYVSLDLSGSPITKIPFAAFQYCSSLVGITIPDSVKSIETNAFNYCERLTSVTFQGTVAPFGGGRFSDLGPFPSNGDLHEKYSAGGIGTYTRSGNTWTKQSGGGNATTKSSGGNSNALVGTTWDSSDEDDFSLTFNSPPNMTFNDDGRGTYTVSGNEVTITITIPGGLFGDERTITGTGTIKGNVLTFDFDGEKATLTKRK
jgi:hypothetical protein